MRGSSQIISILFFSVVASAAPNWEIDLSHCENDIEFQAAGFPDTLYIFGSVRKKVESALKGQFIIKNNALFGTTELAMDRCETGIEKRDLLMRDRYLEIRKWPTAKFICDEVPLPPQFNDTHFGARVPFHGKLLLHGVEHSVSGPLSIRRDIDQIQLGFHFEIKMKDYGIATPTYFGVTVRDEVDVTASVKSKLQPLSASQ